MELNYFKNVHFNLLNDSAEMWIVDPNIDEKNNLYTVKTEKGTCLSLYAGKSQIEGRQISSRQLKN